jgi:hypothetical protein
MTLLVGTRAGLFAVDEASEQVIGGTRINHVITDASGWWSVDGKGRIHNDGDHVASLPDGAASLCIQPSPDTVWIGADQARLFALDDGEVTEDEFFASAPGRENWYTPRGAPADVRSMTLDADHTLYINVHVGGILRYDDTGPVPTLDIDADVHQVAAHPTQKGAIFAATAHGLAASHNGHDFEFRTDGLHANYCRGLAVLDDRVIFSASTGPRTQRGRLYTCPLWEDHIEPVTTGLPEWFDDNLNTYCIDADQQRVYIGHDDQVWVSEDRGISWSVMTSGLSGITCLSAPATTTGTN